MNFFKIKVDKITKETEDALSISFRLDKDHALRQYYPGQYLTVKYHLKEEQFLRCYSLSSLPSDEYLTFTVKKTLKGFISRELVEKTKVGSELEIGEPHGKFKISPYQNNRRSHYFIAAGSGITPIMSMIQFLLEEEPSSSIYLLYSNSDEKDIIFYQKIQELESKYSGQLKTFFTLSKKEKKLNLKLFSKDKMKWSGWKGRINAEMIHKLFEECIDKNKEKEFYLCGPGNFILKTEKILIDSHIDSKHIHKEYFSTLTNVTDEANKRDKFLPSASLKFKLGNIESKVETNPGEKILDALIRNGFEPPYSCSSGACATCIAKLHKGEVIMDSDLALDKSEIEAGWILTCQSRCASKDVEISYQE